MTGSNYHSVWYRFPLCTSSSSMALSNAVKKIQLYTVYLLLVNSICVVENIQMIAETEIAQLAYKVKKQNRMVCDAIEWRETDCMPRDTFVKLKPKPGISYHPDIVKAKVCSGFCDSKVSCIPTKTVTKHVQIMAVDHGMSGDDYCYNITIVEHEKCKCLCTVMEEDCNKDQMYDEENCSCECNANRSDRRKCEKQKNMMWDDEKCTCSCTKLTEKCSSNYYWVPSMCKCMKLM